MGAKKEIYVEIAEIIQDIALSAKLQFDNEQTTPDFLPLGKKRKPNKLKIVYLDLPEWTDDVNNYIVKKLILRTNKEADTIFFLQELKGMFENERVAIEREIGSAEFDRDEQIIFGVKFYSDYQTGQNESRKFAKCIDLAIEELQKGKKNQNTLKAVTKDQHIIRMKMIHTYLKNEMYIDCAENDFLYWFGLKELPKPPAKINWLKADSILKNVIQHICDTSGEQYIYRAFKFNKHYVTTNYKTDYVGSNLFKKIEGYLFHAVTKI